MVTRYETVTGGKQAISIPGARPDIAAQMSLANSGFVDEKGGPIFVPVEDMERAGYIRMSAPGGVFYGKA
jgi:hypothetical protein